MQLPLFPLHSLLMPGGQLPLRIFEPRYLDMVSECFRQSSHFGVCQIREGSEVGVAAMPYPNGTLVHIVDWDKGSDGLLNVLVEGQQKFSVQSMNVMTDDLLMGKCSCWQRKIHARYRISTACWDGCWSVCLNR